MVTGIELYNQNELSEKYSSYKKDFSGTDIRNLSTRHSELTLVMSLASRELEMVEHLIEEFLDFNLKGDL